MNNSIRDFYDGEINCKPYMRNGKNGIYKEHNCSPFLQKIRVVLKGNLHPAVEQERTSVKN